MINFTDRVVIVTGAGRGLGRTYSLALAARGATVVAVDLGCDPEGENPDPSYIEDLVASIHDMGRAEAIGHCCDVRSGNALDEVVADTLTRFGRIDGLVCNAGTLLSSQQQAIGDDQPRLQMEMNHFSTLESVRAVWPQMKRQGYGRVVITASLSALYGDPKLPGFGAANGANIALMQSLKCGSEADGIRINALCPSADTRLTRSLGLSRMAEEMTPDLMVPPLLWLLSESAPNGETVTAGGGHVALASVQESEGLYLGGDRMRPECYAEAWQRLKQMPKRRGFAILGERLERLFQSLLRQRS
ncbi:SDR family NAD(P)-dependent oxidoreductase [Ferrimonas gelatinilytica]|uniref:SDR family NAD(P)-dependent oxidoreductase n=1 Tax=Ferrimonas gelatinilytica TaxID=1255257 RepID=A0ABP9SBL2_9GAMM